VSYTCKGREREGACAGARTRDGGWGLPCLGQPEWSLGEKYGCPAKYGVWSRGPAGVIFLAWAPIFSYWGLSRGPAGVALR